jgi:L-amino acid N-acyltransferase YncA
MTDNPTAAAVRRASSIDAEHIAAIYNEASQGGSRRLRPNYERQPTSRSGLVLRGCPSWWLKSEPVRSLAGGGSGRTAPGLATPGVGEASVYVTETSRGHGIGTALAAALAAEAERAGLYKLLGKLFPENEASRRLVASFGFREVGLHVRHGRLSGVWRDVLLVELLLDKALPA